ncbi:MAG: hypothetical protein DRP67_00435 [Candidatus Omnitrophota bacterium]|nr:MAG: hypothetical protein DRP67_00435 [Candidatus Omnitrophota bacterium]
MKKFLIIFLIFLFPCLLYSQISPDVDEIKDVFKKIESAIKNGDEDLVDIFKEALEIEKRATTPSIAKMICEKICKKSSISEKEFKELREKFSFFDIVVGYGLSRALNISLMDVMKKKEKKEWKEILPEYYRYKDSIISEIRKINPPKKH